MLCALITGHRRQSLHLMSLDNMVKNQSSYCFVIVSLVKESPPGMAQPVLTLSKFAEDQSLCAFTTHEE